MSQRAACRIARCPRSVAQYRIRRVDDPLLLERLKAIAAERRRLGYRRLTMMLRREGFVVNHKRIHRIYRVEGFQLRARRKRGVRYVRGNAVPSVSRPNERWSLDFVHDALSNERKFRSLTIVDDFTRESIGIEVDFLLTGDRVVRVLSRLAETRGLPPTLKFDNGTEFTSNAMLGWAAKVNVELHFIEPGRPMQMAASRASMDAFATSCSTSTRSRPSSMPALRSRPGASITTTTAPTRLSAA